MEKEIEQYTIGFIGELKCYKDWTPRIARFARYFYELGKKDAEREINRELIKAAEKVHEIRDVDYDIHVDTSAIGSFETPSYYENGKLVGQELSKKEE